MIYYYSFKKSPIVSLFFLIIIWVSLKGSESFRNYYLDPPQIREVKILQKTPDTIEIINWADLKIKALMASEKKHVTELNFTPFLLLGNKTLQELYKKIDENPSNEATIHLRFCIAWLLFRFHEYFQDDISQWEKLKSDSLDLFHFLTKNHPDTWEGVYSEIFRDGYFRSNVYLLKPISRGVYDWSPRIQALRKAIPVLDKLDGYQEYHSFLAKIFSRPSKKKTHPGVNGRTLLLENLIEKQGDYKAAKIEIEKYKNQGFGKWINLDYFEERAKDVEERSGSNLISPPGPFKE